MNCTTFAATAFSGLPLYICLQTSSTVDWYICIHSSPKMLTWLINPTSTFDVAVSLLMYMDIWVTMLPHPFQYTLQYLCCWRAGRDKTGVQILFVYVHLHNAIGTAANMYSHTHTQPTQHTQSWILMNTCGTLPQMHMHTKLPSLIIHNN